jgi:hypothetical protein
LTGESTGKRRTAQADSRAEQARLGMGIHLANVNLAVEQEKTRTATGACVRAYIRRVQCRSIAISLST